MKYTIFPLAILIILQQVVRVNRFRREARQTLDKVRTCERISGTNKNRVLWFDFFPGSLSQETARNSGCLLLAPQSRATVESKDNSSSQPVAKFFEKN